MSKQANTVPDAAEFGLLRAFLAKQGAKQQDIDLWVGPAVMGRTRDQIAFQLRWYLKDLPKFVEVGRPTATVMGREVPMYTTAVGEWIYNNVVEPVIGAVNFVRGA